MVCSRTGLLGLFAAIVGTMALWAPSAQAEKGAQWLLAEAVPKSGLVSFEEEQIELESKTNLVLHSKIGGVEVLFECVWASTEIAMLLANGSIGGLSGLAKEAKFRFSSCLTYLNGKLSFACTPIKGGVISTASVHGLIVLHILKSPEGVEIGKDELVQVLPDSGETLATIEMGEECSIGERVPVIGKVFIKDGEKAFLTHLVKHLIEVGPLTEVWLISKTAEHTASLLGSAFAFLRFSLMKLSGAPA